MTVELGYKPSSYRVQLGLKLSGRYFSLVKNHELEG